MLLNVLTNIFHIIVLAAACGIFGWAIAYRLKLAAKGQKVPNLAPTEGRLRSFILNVIFQESIYKQPIRGIMHNFVFYGFLAYLLHTSSQMIAGALWAVLKANGVNPYEFLLTDHIQLFKFNASMLLALVVLLIAAIAGIFLIFNALDLKSKGAQWAKAGLSLALMGAIFVLIACSGTPAYEAVVHHFSLLVLIGLGFFAVRRWVFRAKGLDLPSIPSAIVISLIGTLMISTLLGGGARAYLSLGAHANWISAGISSIFSSRAGADMVFHATWWLHLFTVYAFMLYVPISKHGHLIYAPLNYFMVKDAPRGQMTWMDLEAEGGVWGAGNVTELKWTNLLNGLSCIECARCTAQCPANRTGKPLNPKRIMTETKHAMLDHAKAILEFTEEGNAPSPVIGEPYITEEEIWGCTSCYACVEACPVGNNQVEAIMDMRRHLVQVESRFPQLLQTAFQNMENNSNPWGIGAHTRADWCKDLGVKIMAEDPNVDILYWVGCAGAFDDRNVKIARSFVKILQAAGVNFGILGTEEGCTGDSARRGGNEYLFQTLAAANIELLNNYKVKQIVTACPHCYNTLKNEYPQLGGNFEVFHHSEYINTLIATGKIKLDASSNVKKASYHDSCYLGRYNDIFKQPRSVIKSATGASIAEPADSRSKGLCCGAGGAQMWMEEEYERVNELRTKQLLATGADTIATACPFCVTMIMDGVKAEGKEANVKVQDIAELVAANMKVAAPAAAAEKSEPSAPAASDNA